MQSNQPVVTTASCGLSLIKIVILSSGKWLTELVNCTEFSGRIIHSGKRRKVEVSSQKKNNLLEDQLIVQIVVVSKMLGSWKSCYY